MTSLTIPGLLHTAARDHGDRPFLRIGGTVRTYRQTREAAATMAGPSRPGAAARATVSRR